MILKYINSISKADCEGNPIHLASPEGRKDVKYDLVSAVGCACVFMRCVCTCVYTPGTLTSALNQVGGGFITTLAKSVSANERQGSHGSRQPSGSPSGLAQVPPVSFRYQLKLTKPLFTEPLFVSSFYTNMK